MIDPSRRKELRAQYDQTPPEAGVYRIVNGATNKAFLGSTTDLAGMRNKLAFAKSTKSPGVLDRRLHKDIAEVGIDVFTFEVLEPLEITSQMTPDAIRRDLATLEALWREKLAPAELY